MTADRPTQSISAEDTFDQDVTLTETEPMIRSLAGKNWTASRNELRVTRTVILKLNTSDFKILTRTFRVVRSSNRIRSERVRIHLVHMAVSADEVDMLAAVTAPIAVENSVRRGQAPG
jgi:nucleotidyltransferase/DNA polymerase involved in DNA repair